MGFGDQMAQAMNYSAAPWATAQGPTLSDIAGMTSQQYAASMGEPNTPTLQQWFNRDYANSPLFQQKALPQGVTANTQDPKAFVTNLYQSLLNRAPDQGGLDNWIKQLTSGGMTETGVANAFQQSPEYQQLHPPTPPPTAAGGTGGTAGSGAVGGSGISGGGFDLGSALQSLAQFAPGGSNAFSPQAPSSADFAKTISGYLSPPQVNVPSINFGLKQGGQGGPTPPGSQSAPPFGYQTSQQGGLPPGYLSGGS